MELTVATRAKYWWGKLLGGAVGIVLGGPLGAMLGGVLGHHLDRRLPRLGNRRGERERLQTAFFTATFSVMGHLAKVDGRVCETEIAQARTVMEQMALDEPMRRAAIQLFTEGKSPGFPLDRVLEQFRQECQRRHNLIRLFVEIQLQAAYADGALNAEEERLLLHICRQLRVAEATYRQLERMVRAERNLHGAPPPPGPTPPAAAPMGLREAYALLSVPPIAGNAEITRAYRRLLNQHHPDKLVARGLPQETMQIATQKTQEIRRAYELIREARGF